MESNISAPVSLEFAAFPNYCLNGNSKAKAFIASNNYKQEIQSYQFKSNHILSSKSKSHTRQNSNLRKSKSKCDTETNLSIKKKKTDYESLTKKTVSKKKKKNTQMQHIIFQSNRGSAHRAKRQRQHSLLLKGQKKPKTSKVLFHSSCFSKNHDFQNTHTNPGGLCSGASEAILRPDSKISIESKDILMEKVYEKTHHILEKYKKKCDILDKNCRYYESELNKALKQIKQLKKTQIPSTPKYNKHRESRRGFSHDNQKSKRKNQMKYNILRSTKGKNEIQKQQVVKEIKKNPHNGSFYIGKNR